MRITIAGKREAINTGIAIAKKNWDASKAKIKGTSQEVLANNTLLSTLKTKATEIYSDFIRYNQTPTSEAIKTKLTSQGKETLYLIKLITDEVRFFYLASV